MYSHSSPLPHRGVTATMTQRQKAVLLMPFPIGTLSLSSSFTAHPFPLPNAKASTLPQEASSIRCPLPVSLQALARQLVSAAACLTCSGAELTSALPRRAAISTLQNFISRASSAAADTANPKSLSVARTLPHIPTILRAPLLVLRQILNNSSRDALSLCALPSPAQKWHRGHAVCTSQGIKE